MSNFIPMVSSSPPPIDEKSFEWEEDGEDFGTFTGADESVSETDATCSIISATIKELEENHFGDDNSAESFNSNDKALGSKPCIEDLLLTNDSSIMNIGSLFHEKNGTVMSESVESLDLGDRHSVVPSSMKRDSDSGMFSSDISPIPLSEDGAHEICSCDKINDSNEAGVHSVPNSAIDLKISDTICDQSKISDESICENINSATENISPSTNETPTICSEKASDSDNIQQVSRLSPKIDSLVDSDEEFDKFSSEVLHSISINAAQSFGDDCIVDDTMSVDSQGKHHHSSEDRYILPSIACLEIENDHSGSDNEFSDFADGLTTKHTDNETSVVLNSNLQTKSLKNLELSSKEVDGSSISEPGYKIEATDHNEYNLTKKFNEISNYTDLSLQDVALVDNSNTMFIQSKSDDNLANDNNCCAHVDSVLDTDTQEVEDLNNLVDSAEQKISEISSNHSEVNGFDDDKDEFANFSSVNDVSVSSTVSKLNVLSDDVTEVSSANVHSTDIVYTKDVSTESQCNNIADDSTNCVLEKNYQNHCACDVSVADDKDGFAVFNSANIDTNTAVLQNSQENNSVHNSDDDFADFSSANFANFEILESDNGTSDDWGKFSENRDDDEFGNFNEPVINEAPQIETMLKIVDSERVQNILVNCFVNDETGEDGRIFNISLLDSLLIGSLYQQPTDNNTDTSQLAIKKVLKHVQNYDNTNALIYQWKKSRSNSKLFKTLKIDTQNMLFGLKKQVVPLSVTRLNLLEPIRGSPDNKKNQVIPNLVEPSTTDPLPHQIQDMPPVEFDWDNSGLTNPLEAKTLDLDFMVIQENENSGKTRVFQSELLDAPRSSVKPMQPLEEILKNMKLTTTTASPTASNQIEDLSKEAEKIIDSLPLLSFMKSKVLMFKLQNS